MNLGDDEHIDVCQNIEAGLKIQYEENVRLTDTRVMLALDNAKIAVKQAFGFARNEKAIIDDDTKGVIEWCIGIAKERVDKINNLPLKEYINRIDKVRRSVQRHSEYGQRGYYEFIKQFV